MHGPFNGKPTALPASQGLSWLIQSLGLIRMQAGRLLLIALFMQFMLGLTRLPIIGFLIILAVPGLTAGILEAFHVTAQGGSPGLSLLFKPLTTGGRTGRLIGAGALIFALGVLAVSLLLAGADNLPNPEILARIEQGDVQAIAELDAGALTRMMLAFAVGIAVSGTLGYFMIPLIWFTDRKMGAALMEGLKALIVNWKPFLLLAAGLAAFLMPTALLTGILLGLAVAGGVMAVIAMGLIMILLLVFQMLLFGTQYCAFRAIFDAGQGEPPQAEDEGQLLA